MLVKNTQMLNEENFVCEAEVGYPTAGSIILQTNRNGDFEKMSMTSVSRQSSSDNCRVNDTLTAKVFLHDSSWNDTQLRCAIEDNTGAVLEFDDFEFTIRLMPGNLNRDISAYISFFEKLLSSCLN